MIVTVSDLLKSLSELPKSAVVKVSVDGVLSDIEKISPTVVDNGEIKSVAIIAFPVDSE